MLVATRKPGESIIIDDVIRVTVLATRGNRVRIGIEAPKDTPVHRRETYERIREFQIDDPDPSRQNRIGEADSR